MVGEAVHNITQDGQAEVVVDLEDMETGNGLRVVNDNDPEECIISLHCTGNCAEDRNNMENENETECGLRVGINPEKDSRNGLGVGITEECIISVHCAGDCVSNLRRKNILK